MLSYLNRLNDLDSIELQSSPFHINYYLYLYKYENVCVCVCVSVCLCIRAFLGHLESDWDTIWHNGEAASFV